MSVRVSAVSGAMVDSTHCSQCNALLIEIDLYGERMIGCIECNRWTRDGWIFIDLHEEDIEALRAERAPKIVAEFLELETGWTMLRDDGWYAYYNDEKPQSLALFQLSMLQYLPHVSR